MDELENMFGGDAENVDAPANEAVEPVAEPVIEPVVEATPAVEQVETRPQVPEGYVPLAVVKELREEIRSLKTATPVQQYQPQPQEELYPDEDTLKIVNANQRNQAMQFSRILAEDKFGPDAVQTAYDWAFERCNTDPAFNLQVAQSPHPYKLIVEEHRKAQSLQELGSIDPETVRAFKQWQAAQAQVLPAAHEPTPAPAAPPRSIASLPGAGDVKPPKVSPEEERLAKMF